MSPIPAGFGQIAKGVMHPVPVIANGGLHDPARAARVLEEGHADLVALGRAAIANPDWPKRLSQGAPFVAFDPGILHPAASLENAASWRAARVGGPIGNGENAQVSS
ncbi:MAG TPA: tRNA-dihydrouridine synthase [Polyangiaceae bacterium]|nr:tRNA-dihydrouridine synthase [Polyangiaceae bacterium]